MATTPEAEIDTAAANPEISSSLTHLSTSHLGRIWNTSNPSDFTIICEGHEFPVHKFMLARHSTVFKRMLNPPQWKETKEGRYELHDVNVAVVDAMVNCMYTFNYRTGDHMSSRPAALVFHAQVYSIADMYDVVDLKRLARAQFKEAVQTQWNTADFFSAITEAYATSLPSDQGLRQVIIRTYIENVRLLDHNPAHKQTLEQVPEFAAELDTARDKQLRRQNRAAQKRGMEVNWFVSYKDGKRDY